MVTVLGTDVHWPRFPTKASRSPSGTLEQARAAGGSPAAEADSVAKPCSILYLGPAEPARCGSSVVEHSLGKGEVESSILSRSTILRPRLHSFFDWRSSSSCSPPMANSGCLRTNSERSVARLSQVAAHLEKLITMLTQCHSARQDALLGMLPVF